MFFGWGLYYIYGVFFTPLSQEFHWTRATTSGAFSLSVLVSGVVGVLAGRLSDRFGPKMILISFAVCLALGYALMSRIQTTWHFYLVYGLLVGFGVGGFWAPPISTVARWFVGRRGVMTGIVSGGISVGTLVLPPVVTRLIDSYGWRWTYVILGGIVCIVIIIAAQFLRRSPQDSGLRPPGENDKSSDTAFPRASFSLKEAMRTPQFWMVSGIYLCFGMTQLTVMVHIVPDVIGMNIAPITAAVVLSLIGGVSLVGRIIIGAIADRIRVKNATVFCLSLIIAALIWLQFSQHFWQFCLFAVTFGFGYGGISCLQTLIGVELFGLSALGVITALFSFSFNIGGAVGPVLAGYIFDVSSSYRWAFSICLIVILVALSIALNLKPPRGKSL
jgi:MFS family permease